MTFSRATFVGPVSAAAPEGTLGRKRRRGVSVPVLPQCPQAPFRSRSCPGEGGDVFWGTLQGPFSMQEEEQLQEV